MEGQNWKKYHESHMEMPENVGLPRRSLAQFQVASEKIDIFMSTEPLRILVLGTAGSSSTKDFISIVHSLGRGRASIDDTIVFADLCSWPLQDSMKQYDDDYLYVQLNGLQLPFPHNTFDVILTDLLVNYLGDEELVLLLNQCSRVLQPEGVQMHAAIYYPFRFSKRLFEFLVGNVLNKLVYGVKLFSRTLSDYDRCIRKAQLEIRAKVPNQYTSTVVYAV